MVDWMKPSAQNKGFEFLLIDIDAALTFMDVAETTNSDETRQRNFKNARHAYDTVLQLMHTAGLNAAQKKEVQERLAALRTRLEAAGEQF